MLKRSLRRRGHAVTAAILLSLALPAAAQDRMTFKVIGQPAATGLIQKNQEQAF